VRRQFGVAFDLRDPERPESFEEAEALTRKWAAFEDVALPEGIEPNIYLHDADTATPGSYASIQVSFEWEDDS
jgi:hypothetical protein